MKSVIPFNSHQHPWWRVVPCHFTEEETEAKRDIPGFVSSLVASKRLGAELKALPSYADNQETRQCWVSKGLLIP